MKKITTLAGFLALAVAFGFAGMVNADVTVNDGCDARGGLGDIDTLSASFDAATESDHRRDEAL